ncbi:MAG: HD domain-containing phosphohydrolase [Candidatus Baltobacteraceae bacterium]
MTLFQDASGDPRAATAKLADVLSWYGALGDAAAGNPPGFCVRKASIAVALCEIVSAPAEESHVAFFSGLLHAVGTLGNAAYRKGSDLPERVARIESWDIPAEGARIVATIAALPAQSADLVRWQSECWDGTGYPDQLRWHGIPRTAQFLALADTFARAGDPEEALGAIGLQSGRAFGPDAARAFVTWFHSTGGEDTAQPFPRDALLPGVTSAEKLFDEISDRVDEHNGVSGRWRRVERLSLATADALKTDDDTRRQIEIASRIFGAGELASSMIEDSRFDPLARLGIDDRAKHAALAASLASRLESMGDAPAAVASRGEWYDGTGKPRGLTQKSIPMAARILSATIAYDKLDRAERLDTAVGTQFGPHVVRAVFEAAKAKA